MFNKSKYEEYGKETLSGSDLSESLFDKILENTFAVLTGKEEYHSVTEDVLPKRFYKVLLEMTADFVKNDLNCEEIDDFLLNVCSIAKSRVQKYLRCYENNKLYIQFSLLNIGTYLPHITDVRWKMEYILKSSMVTESDGPIFRISLVVEKFNEKEQCNKINNINFTCTAQELQDLVYKLKDAVRHCNSISSRNS